MKLARLIFPEAQEYADMIGIQYDLRVTSEYCDRIQVLQEATPEDVLLLEGLTHAAVMRYCRAFSPGTRFHLDRDILDGLPQAQLDDHDFFKSLRDKFMAHPVNPFEENSVYAQVNKGANGNIEIPNVQSHHLRMLFLNPNEIQNLRVLAVAVLKRVENLAESKKVTLLELARKISPNQLEYTDGTATRINVSRNAVSQRR
jgi:hypothetical protein